MSIGNLLHFVGCRITTKFIARIDCYSSSLIKKIAIGVANFIYYIAVNLIFKQDMSSD